MNTLQSIRQRFLSNEELAGSNGYCNPIFAGKIADFYEQEIKDLIHKEREEVIKWAEGHKGSGGLRLNTFKEGYESGYHDGLQDLITFLKELEK